MLSTAGEHDAMLQHWSPAFQENEAGIQKKVRAFLPPPIAPAADPMECAEGEEDKDASAADKGASEDVTMGDGGDVEGKDAGSVTVGAGTGEKQEKAKAKDAEDAEEEEAVEKDGKSSEGTEATEEEGKVVDAMGDIAGARRALLGRAIQVSESRTHRLLYGLDLISLPGFCSTIA